MRRATASAAVRARPHGRDARTELASSLKQSYLARMPSSLEQLDERHGEVMAASGTAFFLRFLDYSRLLVENRVVRRAIEQALSEFATAQQKFETEDEDLTAELVSCRRRLVELAPTADDSDVPKLDSWRRFEPKGAQMIREWPSTLANFDAVAAGSADGVVERSWLDQSRSRMLSQILSDKLSTCVEVSSSESNSLRVDDGALRSIVASICQRQSSAHQQWVKAAEATGYLELHQVSVVARYLENPEESGPDTDDDLQRFVGEFLAEKCGSLLSLRQATRSDLGGGVLLEEGTKASIAAYEAECRRNLERLQPQVRERIGGSRPPIRWWIRLNLTTKIAMASLAMAILAVVVPILLS